MKIGYSLINNLIIVDANLNGTSIPMILDTGAAATIVSQKTAEELQLKQADVVCEGMGAGGNVGFASVEIETLSIGDVSNSGLTGMTMDMSEVCNKIDFEVGGILGYNFLSSTRLTIDFPAQELTIEKTA